MHGLGRRHYRMIIADSEKIMLLFMLGVKKIQHISQITGLKEQKIRQTIKLFDYEPKRLKKYRLLRQKYIRK